LHVLGGGGGRDDYSRENKHLNIPKPGIEGFKPFGWVCCAQAQALLKGEILFDCVSLSLPYF